MEKLEIQCAGKKAPEIYAVLKSKLTHFKDAKKLPISDLKFDDAIYEGLATGTGFKARLSCKDDKVLVELDLNFLLKPMKGQIVDTIKNSVTKALT